MIDRDKVISRLQIIRTWAEVGKNYNGIQGESCLRDVVDWIDDALALLKAQEPRVLTLDEVRYEYEVVWLETKYLQPTVCLFYNGESNVDWLYFVFGLDDSFGVSVHLYGKNWRCWSAKPTEEQREAVPWTE